MAHVTNPSVPYIGPFGVLQPGGIIQIAGHVPPHAKWFAINLQCGPNTNPRDDIALHINPRFEGNLSKVVRNSLQSQQWGVEENFGHFPFGPGQQFEVLILTEPDHFKIAINGQHYTEFRHRIPVQRVTTIAIDGDVQLFTIRYESPVPQHQQSYQGAPPLPHQQSYQGQPGGQYGIPSASYHGGPPPAGLAPGAYQPQQPAYYGAQAPGGYGTPSSGGYGSHQPPSSSMSSGYGYGYGAQSQSMQPSVPYSHATSSPLPVPGASPGHGRKSPSMLPGIAAGAGGGVLAGAAAYGLSRLMYPHGGMGYGHGGFGKVKGMKGMKVKGMKHKSHKPKFHKFHKQKGMKHKWKKGGGWGSHSSSSSEESE